MTGCFTGVESTPRITDRNVRKSGVRTTPEMTLLDDVVPQPPSQWQAGKRFYVTDNRVQLLFTPGVDGAASTVPDSLGGTELRLGDVSLFTGLNGDSEVQLAFADADGHRLIYRPGLTEREFKADSVLAVPFTIDLDMVQAVRKRLAGNTYYLLSARRFDKNGVETEGLRYIPVKVTDVGPGNDNQPLRVFFVTDSTADIRTGRPAHAPTDTMSVLMTIGHGRTATRNFDTMFALDNPRKQYPQITDRAWADIMRSRVRIGMTPVECRLALGTPNEYLKIPTTAGMVERWTYGDGVYLFFEDGVLSRFRR